MNRSIFHKAYSLMLIIALAFGQVGAGFFHNKHDAHETVIDLDHTVLLPHGEHCKICSVDWVHQFVADVFGFDSLEIQPVSFVATDIIRVADSIILFENGRAPPFRA
jgi:hypothetical protein